MFRSSFDVIIIIVLLKGFRYVITFLHYRKSILKSILVLVEEKGNEKKSSKQFTIVKEFVVITTILAPEPVNFVVFQQYKNNTVYSMFFPECHISFTIKRLEGYGGGWY